MSAGAPELERSVGRFDATLLVMGGIVGSGIFMNPAVVARRVHGTGPALAAWAVGGLIALAGAFIYAELAARRPRVGGQYAYLREAFHPALAFVYGWGLLLVVQSGGMAAGAITFARYLRELTGLAAPEWTVAAGTLALLSLVNALGVRAGAGVQSALMLLKIAAIALLVVAGAGLAPAAREPASAAAAGAPLAFASAFGSAMVPVLFAYGGWQTASFVAGELRAPRRDLPWALLAGVLGVIALYLAVNAVCLRVLGAHGLAGSDAPASAVLRAALGGAGARLIALGIALSTLGFLSQSMLTAPRVYFAMAADGVFFAPVGRAHPRSHAPVAAIVLQGACAAVIAASGRFEQILDYVVPVDWIFFGLTACSLFVLRRRDAAAGVTCATRVPGHPWTTAAFALASAALVANTLVASPANSAVGVALLVAGLPVYAAWRRARRSRA